MNHELLLNMTTTFRADQMGGYETNRQYSRHDGAGNAVQAHQFPCAAHANPQRGLFVALGRPGVDTGTVSVAGT